MRSIVAATILGLCILGGAVIVSGNSEPVPVQVTVELPAELPLCSELRNLAPGTGGCRVDP
jgi:hypothetical protein